MITSQGAEELQSSFGEIDKQVSEPILTFIILKCLGDDFDVFVTIFRFSKDEQNLDSSEGDLVNF